ncbi:hypothetical protein [Paraconexibacter algicola]|uniref:Uncharacterized protein n=1 Tax=Paraconexibacter algicola TaxID=2133960 RepID=A0A2T4UM15_9ACTN|nr:hypothetical protein [Paraconexibacter algicola]PTL60248.1 hypothetical protein C7Y72_11670 [Paraconexibacter algicola]
MLGDHFGRYWKSIDESEEPPALVEVEPELAGGACCPARRCAREARIMLVCHQDENPKCVSEIDVRQFTSCGVYDREVLGQEGAAEARVCVSVIPH